MVTSVGPPYAAPTRGIVSEDHHQRILEKLRRLDKLARGASTDSEREAAEAARRRLVERLETDGVHVAPELAAEVGIDGQFPAMVTADGPTTEIEAEDPFQPRGPTLVGGGDGDGREQDPGLTKPPEFRRAPKRGPTMPNVSRSPLDEEPVYEEAAHARTVAMGVVETEDLLSSFPPSAPPMSVPVNDLRSGFYPSAPRPNAPRPNGPPPPGMSAHREASRFGRPPARAATAVPGPATVPPPSVIGTGKPTSFGWKKLLVGVLAFGAGLEVTRMLLKPDDLSLGELYTARAQSVAQATSACLKGDDSSCGLLGTRISTHAGRWASPEERSQCSRGESTACRSLGRRFSLESKASPDQRGPGYSAVACALGAESCAE